MVFFLNAKQNILWIIQGFVCVPSPVLYWDVLDSTVFFMNYNMMPQFRMRTHSVVNVICHT